MLMLTTAGYQSLGHLRRPLLNNPVAPGIPEHVRSIWSNKAPEPQARRDDIPDGNVLEIVRSGLL